MRRVEHSGADWRRENDDVFNGRHPSLMLVTIAYFSTVGVIGLVSGVVGPTLNGLASQTGVALSTIGLVVTTRSLGYLFGAIWSGGWSDGAAAHRTVSFTLGVSAISLAVIPFASNLWVLLGIMTVLGTTLGALDVAGNTLVLCVHHDRPEPYVNALHFFFGLGGLLAPFVVSWSVLLTEGISWAYWALALIPIPFALILLRTPSPQFTAQQADRASLRAEQKLTLGFILSASLYLFYVGGQISLVSWFFVYCEGYTSTQVATLAMGGFWAAFSVFRLLGVAFSKRWSPERILAVDYAVVILAALPMMIWPGSAIGIWVGAIGMGGAHASIYATSILFLRKRYQVAGKQMSAITVLACAGMMLFPWLMGKLFTAWGPWVVPGVSTMLMVAALLITLATWRKRAVREARLKHEA